MQGELLILSNLRSEGRIVSAGPNMFRCGDIVELSIEFCAFPAGSRKHTLVPVLRGIRMIDADLRLVSCPQRCIFSKSLIILTESRYYANARA